MGICLVPVKKYIYHFSLKKHWVSVNSWMNAFRSYILTNAYMSKINKGHNKKVILKSHDQLPKCNCRKKMESECPMEGNCLMTQFINVT